MKTDFSLKTYARLSVHINPFHSSNPLIKSLHNKSLHATFFLLHTSLNNPFYTDVAHNYTLTLLFNYILINNAKKFFPCILKRNHVYVTTFSNWSVFTHIQGNAFLHPCYFNSKQYCSVYDMPSGACRSCLCIIGSVLNNTYSALIVYVCLCLSTIYTIHS